MMKIPRIMLAAGASGSGKTLITCAILQTLINKGVKPCSFKCGPDYIDPMFHSKVIGAKSRNLDTFFASEEIVRYILAENSKDCDIAVIEGVMGYYDGLGGVSTRSSAYDVARVTDTPVVLIVNAKGMSASAAAFIKGFADFRDDSNIKGVILNQVSPMLYNTLKTYIEEECGIKVLGYLPKVTDCLLESRHLGLVMPDEIEDIKDKLAKLAEIATESIDIEGLIELAESASDIDAAKPAGGAFGYSARETVETDGETTDGRVGDGASDSNAPELVEADNEVSNCKAACGLAPRIALARDEAFCFMYEDNLKLLRDMGAEIVEFSPISDPKLPEDVSGIILYGGYPELYADRLTANESMRHSIKAAIDGGMPILAECGGFMYLHETMEDNNGVAHEGVGVIKGQAFKTSKLGRFGYITLTENEKTFSDDNQNRFFGGVELEPIPAHEFHYFDSTNNGDAFSAAKPVGKRKWDCIHQSETMLAGFPHLYYYGNPQVPAAFISKCSKFQKQIRRELEK